MHTKLIIQTAVMGLLLWAIPTRAQFYTLDSVLVKIETQNPGLKMYDADIKSMDAAAAGAKSWMPPQVGAGLFMTPYNPQLWKASDMGAGMGSFMVSVQQMIPNPVKQNADFEYMQAMSSVEEKNKQYTYNQMAAWAKTAYYRWQIINKKTVIANENLLLLDFMIKSMETRYQYNMDKISTYFKAQSKYGELENMLVMLKNGSDQSRITLNTLMAQDKAAVFSIDTSFELKDYSQYLVDTAYLYSHRSDLQAIDKTIHLNDLKIETQKASLLPDFGVRFDHMAAFGDRPQQFSLMGMITIPIAPWSAKMSKANINSLKLKTDAFQLKKEMIVNETSGMLRGMVTEYNSMKRQWDIHQNTIIPALKKNYETALIAWQNNTGELFLVLDAWEALNMAQMTALDALQSLLDMQIEIEKQLEIQ